MGRTVNLYVRQNAQWHLLMVGEIEISNIDGYQLKGEPDALNSSRLLNNYNMGLVEEYKVESDEIFWHKHATIHHYGFLKNNRRRIHIVEATP